MSHIFRARKTQQLLVSDRQMSIIAGSLLGDAHIRPLGKIQFEHSIKAKEYLKWKFDELRTISYQRIGFIVRQVSENPTASCRFLTRQYFRPLRRLFYRSGKKYISTEVLRLLTPHAIAVWYMDDGHYERVKQRCIIATDGFSDADRKGLCNFLRKKFDLVFVIQKSGKISLTQKETQRFFRLICPYRIKCMAYKFPDPLTTNPDNC